MTAIVVKILLQLNCILFNFDNMKAFLINNLYSSSKETENITTNITEDQKFELLVEKKKKKKRSKKSSWNKYDDDSTRKQVCEKFII